ncbi:MAG: phospholipid carrier-dependent glycosyltransferase, partial [Clostridia bacterium]
VAPWLLPALTALASCTFGIGLLWREKKQTNALSLRKKRTLLALCSFALAVAQALVWIFAGNYAAYGYAMMVYCFAYAIVCMCVDPKPEGLPFYMALALIGIYLLGVKVHERYLFPALALLLLSYITTKDRRALHLCVGFSITTFLNTAIVLDNSILFGAAQGHLNSDTLALNVVLCVVNLLLCGYAGYIALSGLRETVEAPTPEVAEEETQTAPPAYKQMLLEPMDARLHLTLRDWLVMGVTTVLYGVLAFSNLGSTVAPQDGWISTSPDEQIIFELPQSQSFKILYYAGVSYNGFSVAVSEDGQSWSNDFYCEMREGLCYRWNYACQSEIVEEQPDFAKKLPDDVRRFHDQYVRLNTSTDGVLWLKGKYLRLNADEAGLNLFEIALRDANDELIPLTVVKHTGANESLLADAKPAQNLLNEQNTCVGEPGWFTGTYFDEIYHARTAYEHLHGQAPYETTHPPLGKLMMSVGIALFGMTPFGWRFAGAFIGVWMLPALYLLALQLTKRRSLATVAMLALTFDLMHYTQTRIATIDSFPVLFIILSYLLMARYMQTDVFAVGAGEKPRLFTKAYWRSLIPLALCGLCMGLSIASKWIGLYSAVGLAVLFFIAVYRQYRVGNIAYAYSAEDADEEPNENRRARIFGAQEFALKRVFMTCGFCVLFFILVPCVIYYLSYIPYLSPTGPVTLQRIIAAQQGMLSYHSTPGLGMDHPFQSPWWQWPFILKPMWFSQDKFEPDGYAATIMCMGNPWVFYIGAICMVAIILAFVLKYVKLRDGVRLRRGDGDLTLCIVIIGFMAQYLPWVLVPRSMYMYHYFASVPFIILATVWMIGKIPDSRRAWRRGVIALYVAGAIAFFVMFFPYASGWLTSTSWLDAMKWFSKLYY